MVMLTPGAVAPVFTLPDASGEAVSLEDYLGGRLLVYFYPKADTPGCTTQSCAVRDAREELGSLDVAVVGISPDPPGRQAAFDEKYGLGFPLLSDPDHRVADAWGAWGERSMYGKTYLGIIRSAFLVGADGRIEHVWYKVAPKDTVPNVLAALAD
jgi:thioredoxin-dependent peroxiredoxin